MRSAKPVECYGSGVALVVSSEPVLNVVVSDLKNNDPSIRMQELGIGRNDFHEQDRIVRLLGNLIEWAVLKTRGDALEISGSESTTISNTAELANASSFDERERIVRILKETKGRVGGANGAAARLGLKRTTLITRMKKLGIDARRLSRGWS